MQFPVNYRTPLSLMIVAGLLLISPTYVFAGTPPSTAKSYIISPQDGAVVSSPVRVVFGLTGMGVAPAGVDKPGTGHHHLLINADKLPAMDVAIPKDKHHRHFGGGQTETQLALEPGTYTLQLLLGDKNHVPVANVKPSEKITITVK